MLLFVLRRLLYAIPVVLGVVTLAFLVLRVLPGDPVTTMLNGAPATPEVVARLQEQFHFDRPLVVQYGYFLSDLGHGQLGTSMQTGGPVWSQIGPLLGSTLALTGAALAAALLLGLGGGLVAALFPRWLDLPITVAQLVAVSIPGFWVGLMLLTVFSFKLGWFPATGNHGPASLVLPALTLALPLAAIVGQLVRDGLREVLAEPYIVTARAKGYGPAAVLWRHALRNALVPVVSVSGLATGSLLAGAVIVESVFARPGVGRLAVTAITNRDLPTVQGVVLVAAIGYVLITIGVDVLYALVDPRIRQT